MAALGTLGALPKDERKAFGQRANQAKQALERAYDEAADRLRQAELRRRAGGGQPGRHAAGPAPAGRGRLHPATQMLRRICAIFADMGFQVYRTREVETDEYNFELLNMPPHHPARDMWDTFYTTTTEGVLLRTHTSPGQIHAMRELRPGADPRHPAGRCATATSRSRARSEIQFYQVEGLAVGRNITMADLKGTLDRASPSRMFGADAARALPRQLLPVHRAERRDGRGLHRLRRQGLPDLQGERLAGDPGRAAWCIPTVLAERRLRPAQSSPASPSAWAPSASPCCVHGIDDIRYFFGERPALPGAVLR